MAGRSGGGLRHRFAHTKHGPHASGEEPDRRARALGAAARRAGASRLRAGRPQLRAAGGARVAAIQGDQGLEDRDAAGKRARKASGGPSFMIRSSTASSESSSYPIRRSSRTKPPFARRWRSSTRRAPGYFPTINGTGSATRSSPGVTTLTAEASGMWTLDVWGQVRREIEAQQAGAQTSAANLANALLAQQSLLALSYVTLREAEFARGPARQDRRRIPAFADASRKTSITPGPPPSPTSSPLRRKLLNAQAALIAAGVIAGAERTCDRGPDGPPARRPFDSARSLGDDRSFDPGRAAVLAPGAKARRRGGGADHAPGQR